MWDAGGATGAPVEPPVSSHAGGSSCRDRGSWGLRTPGVAVRQGGSSDTAGSPALTFIPQVRLP